MKKYIISTLLCVFSFILSSCEGFLDLTPKSELTDENAYQDPDDWQQTLNAAYGSLQEVFMGKTTMTLGEFGTDEVIPFDMGWGSYAELHYYTFSVGHPFFSTHYRSCYDGIKRCNLVIDMPSGVVSSDQYELMVKQARFLRGLFYFDLVRMYGGIPLWTKSGIDSDDVMKARSSAEDVYSIIVEDLKSALSLPEKWTESKDKGRATSYAAQAFLARVYLQWGKPDEALTYCKMLDGKFHLYNNYADIYDPKKKNEEYENIFEVQFKHSGKWGLEGSHQHSYWGPRGVGGPTSFGGWGGFGFTQYLYDSYDAIDKRKTAFFFTEFAGVTQTPPSCAKFWDAEYGNVIEDDNLNFTLMRYADVLLMKAEALNATDATGNEKYDALNAVRGRAGITLITAADGLTKEQFDDVLLKERMLELCGERTRRWDLIRFGKLASQVLAAHGVTVKSHQVLYPIPQDAIDANDLLKDNNNPGY